MEARKAREEFVAHCRQTAVQKLAEYKIHYEVEKRTQLDRMLYKKKGPTPKVTIHWTPELNTIAAGYYSEFFPGYLIYESENQQVRYAIYRIEKEDLIKIIQKRPPPFEIQFVQ